MEGKRGDLKKAEKRRPKGRRDKKSCPYRSKRNSGASEVDADDLRKPSSRKRYRLAIKESSTQRGEKRKR